MDHTPANILLVDDDAASRHLIERILSKSDCQFKFNVEIASDETVAVEHLKNKRFDAILLNPAPADGTQAHSMNKIRTLSGDVPVIMLAITPDDSQVPGLAERLRRAIANSRSIRALKQTCKTFKSIVYNAPDAIICTTPAGRILEFNAAAQRLWGRDRTDVIGKSFLETCFTPEERPHVCAEMQKIADGRPVDDITTVLRADTGDTTLFWKFSSIYGNGDTAPVIIAAAHEAAQQAEHDGRTESGHIAFKPEFNDTVDLVLNSLCAIIERIDKINHETTPQVLDRLQKSYGRLPATARNIPADKARAVERLILSLITQEQKQAS
jgi:PAS domain S-box-containing protein